MAFGTVEQAIQDLRNGKFVVVADDESRENEGDLICAAELVTTDMVNFMLRAKGMICVALEPTRVVALGLTLQARENTDAMRTAFTVSVDAGPQYGVTTGISASDRAPSIRVVADPTKGPADIRTPGHIHPLRARDGGVLQRVGHTEAAVDLCRLAGLTPAGVICEILNDDGHPMRRDALDRYASTHGLTFITVADLVAHRLTTERLVHRVAEARLPTDTGGDDWRIVGYRNDVDDHEHVAIAYGDLAAGDSVLVRMHSKCLTGDVFHSRRCDCGWQLHKAMEVIVQRGARRHRVPRPGRTRHRAAQQAQGVRAAGRRRTTRSRPTRNSASRPTSGTTASARRSCSTSALGRSGCSPTTRRSWWDSRVTAWRSWTVCTSRRRRTDENAGYLDAKRDKLGHLLST